MIRRFTDFDSLIKHFKIFPNEFSEDDIVYCEKENKNYRLVEGNWLEEEASNPMQLNLYDLNKTLVQQLPPLTPEELQKTKVTLDLYAEENPSNYYMLLCRELNYYTVFAFDFSNPEFSSLGYAIEACYNGLGIIYSVEYDKENKVIEIWFAPEEGMTPNCAFLFDYTPGVITFGG